MTIFFLITSLLMLVSLIANRQKTMDGLKKGAIRFFKLIPTLLTVIILVSVALFFTPEKMLIKYFGDQAGALGYVMAALVGSVSLVPGFISYPMAGMLLESGVSYGILALFITTLKMVDTLTIPVEAKYFGMKVTLIRNGLSFLGVIVIGIIMAIIFSMT